MVRSYLWLLLFILQFLNTTFRDNSSIFLISKFYWGGSCHVFFVHLNYRHFLSIKAIWSIHNNFFETKISRFLQEA